MIIISDLSIEESSTIDKGVTTWELLIFFLPLASTTFLMLLTHSLYNAGLARLPDPEFYLAAFAVAKSFNNVCMSPINMIKQTVVALVNNKANYYRVRKFVFSMAAIAVFVFIGATVSGLAEWIFKHLMGVDEKLLETSVNILKIFMLTSITITFRDFYQAIAIKFKKTYLVPLATGLRIIYVFIIVLSVRHLSFVSAALIAGGMHFGATLIEAMVMSLGTKITLKNIPKRLEEIEEENNEQDAKLLNLRYILAFFIPLAVTSILKTMQQPYVNARLAETLRPEIAISTYAVAWGLGMNILSPLNMFHQIPLKYLDNEKNYKSVKKFGFIIGSALFFIMFITAYTNVGVFILSRLIGTSKEITFLSMEVLKIMCILAVLRVGREFYWGLFMQKRMTKYISYAKFVSYISLFLGIAIMIAVNPYNAALIGVVGMIASEGAEFLYLVHIYNKNKEKIY